MHALAIAGLVLALGSFVVLCVMPALFSVAVIGQRSWKLRRLRLLAPLAMPLTFDAAAASLLAARRYEVTEICRAFGVPLHVIEGPGDIWSKRSMPRSIKHWHTAPEKFPTRVEALGAFVRGDVLTPHHELSLGVDRWRGDTSTPAVMRAGAARVLVELVDRAKQQGVEL